MSNENDTLRGFDLDDTTRPQVFLQWKGTDACFDFHCKCGLHCHYDGDFAYFVKCPQCKRTYEMPFILFPREVDPSKVDAHPLVELEED